MDYFLCGCHKLTYIDISLFFIFPYCTIDNFFEKNISSGIIKLNCKIKSLIGKYFNNWDFQCI